MERSGYVPFGDSAAVVGLKARETLRVSVPLGSTTVGGLAWSVFVFAVLTLVIGIATAAIVLEQHRQAILDDWVSYRCNPLIMPVAIYFGKDTIQNFEFCMQARFKNYAGYLFEPFSHMFSLIADSIGDITQAIDDIRGSLSSVRGGFLTIIDTVFGKIQNVMSEITVLFIRMRDILNRMVSAVTVMAYIGATGAETGESLLNGPVGQVMSYFCFAGDTVIKMWDGDYAIDKITPGQHTRSGAIVETVWQFLGKHTPMYAVGASEARGARDVVSGSHLIKHNDKFKRVDSVPGVERAPGERVIYCLSTSDNKIETPNAVYRDWEESNDPAFIAGELEDLDKLLGTTARTNLAGWNTGLNASTPVLMADGSVLRADELVLGDFLGVACGMVVGIGRSELTDPTPSKHRGQILADTAIAFGSCVADAAPLPERTQIIHLLTSTNKIPLCNSSGCLIVFDDNECTDPSYLMRRAKRLAAALSY